MSCATLARGVVLGLVGGLVGTIVMDLFCIGTLWAVGLPAVIGFSTIGDTAAALFALLGIEMTGGLPLGAAVHYLMGLVLGGLELANSVLRLPFELPIFAILLITLGAIWLAREILQARNA